MKSIKIIGLLLPLFMGACNSFLEFDETNNLKTEEDVFTYFETTDQTLTAVYSFLPQDLGVLGGAMRDAGSDDAEYANTGAAVQDFNTGNWSAINTLDTQWELYKGIRAANTFLGKLETVDFSRYEYTANYQKWMVQLATFEAQARVLRATYFFELARRYGDIAMPLEVIDIKTDRTIAKTAFVDVIQFIADECDACAQALPLTYDTSEYDKQVGRVSRGYAYALKSKALLYAASKLHNPGSDVEKWKASAEAAWNLIRLSEENGLYTLDPNGVANNPASREAIMLIRNGNSSTFELNNFPIRLTAGKRSNLASGTFPSQNLVDAFETINGYAVTLTDLGWVSEDPEFDATQPFANRDPRFYRTVLADGMTFKGITIDVKDGGLDHLAVNEGGTPTGYFLKKYVIEGTNFAVGQEAVFRHTWVAYRYAETLLSYAESMIYAFGDPNYTDGTFTKSALDALNEVRANAGMPAKAAATKDEFIKALRNEWRVEFAFEDHRFWDIRRWGIGAETQRELNGVRILENGGRKEYRKIVYEIRQWKEAMNLYPIPQEKLFVNTNLAPQNDGWN
jgi:hypothetical protein